MTVRKTNKYKVITLKPYYRCYSSNGNIIHLTNPVMRTSNLQNWYNVHFEMDCQHNRVINSQTNNVTTIQFKIEVNFKK